MSRHRHAGHVEQVLLENPNFCQCGTDLVRMCARQPLRQKAPGIKIGPRSLGHADPIEPISNAVAS